MRTLLSLLVTLVLVPTLAWAQPESRSGSKGTSTPLSITGRSVDADHNAWDMFLTNSTVATAIAVRCVNAANTAFESCAGAGGAGGTSMTDNAAFTGGSDSVTPMGALYDTTPPTVTDGSVGVPRMSSTRVLLVDPSGVTSPVSAATLPLPTGAATSASQTTANTSLSSIDGKITAVDTGAVVVASGSITANAGTNLNTSALLTTTAHDAAFGTAGTADAQVRSVQGVASGTPLDVTCSSGCSGGIQYAQGTAGGNTDTLTMAGAVRRDTAAVATGVIDGDNATLNVDATGRLWAHVGAVDGTVTVDGSGVTQPVSGTVTANAGTNLNTSALLTTAAHDAAFGTAGSADAQVRTVQGVASMTPLLVDGSATTQPVSGTVTVTDGAGALNVIVDSGTVTVGTFPDNEPFNVAQINGVTPLMGNGVTGTGSQRVTVASDNTAFTVNIGTFPDNEPVNLAQVAGTTLSTGLGVAGTGTPRVTMATANSLQPHIDPCQAEAKTFITINQTANTQLATGTASERIYICHINVVVGAAQNVSLVSGTGTVCATSTAGVPGISGGATAATGWNFAANGGIAGLGNGGYAVGQTDTDADNICLFQSGSAQVSGGLSYVSR